MIEDRQARRRRALSMLALGVVVFFFGLLSQQPVWRWGGRIGAALILVGLARFLLTLRGEPVRWPHPAVALVTLLGIALHVYEQLTVMPGRLSVGWLSWGLTPYLLALALSAFAGTRTAAIAGAGAALLFDLALHHDVVAVPRDFGSAFIVIFRPLVSTLVIVPAVTYVAWRVVRLRSARAPAGGSAARP